MLSSNPHYLLTLLRRTSPISTNIAFQIHSQLTTNANFNQFPNTHFIFFFNTLLRHYTLGESPQHALSLYKQAHVSPTLLSCYFDTFTYSFLLKACARLNDQILGTQFHSVVLKLGFESHVYVMTALVNMYVDFGLLSNARQVFDEMSERNLVTWNAMVSGFVKWGCIEDALLLFREMPTGNVVSRTCVIDGCSRMKKYVEAFSLFEKMIMDGGIMPTEVTLLAIFPAIADTGDIKNCQSCHGYGYNTGFLASSIRVANCLIDTYAKCGCIQSALKIFEETALSRRDLVSWTSIICGFAMHGMAKEAAKYFDRMKSFGFKPNRVTFLGVLNSCSHGGLVDEGLRFFEKMTGEGQVTPDIKHYGCVIDMLGRAGRLREAEEIALESPDHVDKLIIWRTLLGACSFHGDTDMAKRVTSKIQEIDGGYGGDYVLMSNILTGQGRFREAESTRALLDNRSISKTPGHSH